MTLSEKVQAARELEKEIARLQTRLETYQEDLYINHNYFLKI